MGTVALEVCVSTHAIHSLLTLRVALVGHFSAVVLFVDDPHDGGRVHMVFTFRVGEDGDFSQSPANDTAFSIFIPFTAT